MQGDSDMETYLINVNFNALTMNFRKTIPTLPSINRYLGRLKATDLFFSIGLGVSMPRGGTLGT
jgi:hypothetical protein